MPAIVAKEGTATWLPVLTWLPGQLLNPPLTALHASLPGSSTHNSQCAAHDLPHMIFHT